MNRIEAKEVLRAALGKYRALSFGELCERLGESECFEMRGASGSKYQVEVQFFWDDRPGGDVRVIGSIDNGIKASRPLGEAFIVSGERERG